MVTPALSTAHWIWSAEGSHAIAAKPSPSHYQVRMFRREFFLESTTSCSLPVAVSADSRYVLYLNGHLVARGPARGDINHHFYDPIDLTPHLQTGTNVLAAWVIDMSRVAHRPEHLGPPCSVMTYTGGFLLGGSLLRDGAAVEDLSTDERWKVMIDRSYRFQNLNTRFEGYHGYFEHLVSRFAPEGWQHPDFDDADWEPATRLYPAETFETRRDPASPYGLLCRIIPQLREDSSAPFADLFLEGGGPAEEAARALLDDIPADCSIPPHTTVRWIFDAGAMTTAFPRVVTSGGVDARLTLTYAEALRLPWDTPGATLLGKRQPLENLASHYADESTGWTFDRRGTIQGWCDIWEPAGNRGREHYAPLHWRAFRYLGLEITTGDDPITVHAVRQAYCAYPYEVTGEFECSSPSLNSIWKISLRTMQLCTHETFEDCVHYEQMQYAGDTMITSRLAMLVSGDYRISKQAILHFDWSRVPEGLTQSRYPSRLLQIIPSWSLHWITAIRDYLLFSGDFGTARDLLPGVSSVLAWFARHTDDTGLPVRLPYWNTTDWCPRWKRGQPPGWDTGPTCVISSQYVVALREAAWLFAQLGQSEKALRLLARADRLAVTIHGTFWSEQEGLYFDHPDGPEISQYGNAWAIVAGAASPETRKRILKRFPGDPHLAPVSFFGWHAVFSALETCGAYKQMPRYLGPWEEMLANGLSTWAEENTYWRSLCHAWTAHPAVDFLTRIVGIRATTPGFATAEVTPHPCDLQSARGRVCTPHGPISAAWTASDRGVDLTVEHPAQVAITVPAARSCESTEHADTIRLTATIQP